LQYLDLSTLFSLDVLLAIIVGTFVGLFIGALPGLGSQIAIILLLPFTFTMDPLVSILLLLAAYQGAEYGGSISSIVLGIPGTPSAIVTVFDGATLARQGKSGEALGYSLTASLIGGLVGGLALLFLTRPMAKFALNFSDPEFFLIGILGLLAVSALSSKDFVKSMIFAVLGLLVGTIGMDMFTGLARFTFGRPELMSGVNLVPVLVGMFAFTELFKMIDEDMTKKFVVDKKNVRIRLPRTNLGSLLKFSGLGSLIGTGIGIFPGLGGGTSSWFSYVLAKKISKKPETFGKGNPEGIMAPESANNATVGGALMPMPTLGIPGASSIAILLGVFIIHGIQPGPALFTKEPALVSGLLWGFLLTSIAMFVLGLFVTGFFSRMLTLPLYWLVPVLLVLSLLGVYASKGMFFEIWLSFIFGVFCYLVRDLDFSFPAFVLAFVLSPIIEESFRRSLMLSNGSYAIFVQRPYSLAILAIIAIILAIYVYRKLRRNESPKEVIDEQKPA